MDLYILVCLLGEPPVGLSDGPVHVGLLLGEPPAGFSNGPVHIGLFVG